MKPTSLHEHARRRLDAVVRQGYDALRRNGRARSKFSRLLIAAREHSTLLHPTARGHREREAVEALVRIALQPFLRPPETWPGGDGSRYQLVGSLATHVLAAYPVPEILAHAWLGPTSNDRRLMQRWFVEHGRGRPFRTVSDLPLPLTRAMERHFLSSPPHLPIRAALRRAEVLGLGGPKPLADAIARTVLGRRLTEHAFWRPILLFLVDHREALTEYRTLAIIEALEALQPRLRELDEGRLRPERLIRGRTPETLERTLAELQGPPRPRGVAETHQARWSATGVAGWAWSDPSKDAVSWHIVELLAPEDLTREGRVLRHCVGTYVGRCVRGTSRIWSLRWQSGGQPPEPRYTIEVHPKHRCIVQIRGRRNRRPSPPAIAVIRAWAERRGLKMSSSAWA